MFVPLHVKSGFSLGYGIAHPEDLVQRAAELGYGALALTDDENLYGQVRFHSAARAAGIRPITGVEISTGAVDPDLFDGVGGRLVLLARDESGFQNICRIVSRRRTREARAPEPSLDESIVGRTEGLYVLSESVPLLDRLLTSGVPSDALRGLLVRTARESADPTPMPAYCAHRGISLVAGQHVVLTSPEEHALHELRVVAARGLTLESVRHGGIAASPSDCLLPVAQVRELFADVPEALEETERIAEECSFDLLGATVKVPAPAGVPDRDHNELLATRCASALPRLEAVGGASPRDYRARLGHELGTIARMNLAGYFLVVARIMDEARRRNIGVTARGSAVSSLVVHLLGISAIDPLAEGLVFERFLNVRRADVPDIDLDVDSDRRDELMESVRDLYGVDRTATVGSVHTIQLRTAYSEALPALGIPPRSAAAFCRRIKDSAEGMPRPDVPTALLPARIRAQTSLIERLVGIPHHFSAHPGGIVIGNAPLAGILPLERTEKGVTATQFDREGVRERGLVKIDLLGNRTLSELATVRRLVPREAAPDLLDLPLDDRSTLQLIDRGDTIGCFQVESPAVRSVLRRLPVRSIRDVTVALALVRPGAAAGDAKSAFLRRARGLETAEAPPPVREVLRESLGMLLFEEDVIRVIAAMSGFGLSEADRVRAVLLDARADAGGEIERFRARSVDVIGADTAGMLWRDLERFAAYSFSRAHAASYAMLAYASAFMKAHFPEAFTCALIAHHGGMYPLRAVVAEMMRRGVDVLGPGVNNSDRDPSLEGRHVRVGIGSIKHLSRATEHRLLEARRERPFSSVQDLVERISPSARDLEALVLSGACDGLSPLSFDTYPAAHERILEEASQGRAALEAGAFALRDHETSVRSEDPRRYRSLVRIRNELRFLAMHIHAHPMQVLRDEAAALGLKTAAAAAVAASGRMGIAGVVSAARIVPTADGPMQYVTLEDETGTVECVLYPRAYRQAQNRVSTPGPYTLYGTMRITMDDPHLEVDSVQPFYERLRAR